MRKPLLVLLLVTSPGFARADYSVECTRADDTPRVVAINYSKSGSPVPCEVTYTANGKSEVLWSAAVKTGYCEAKAEAFLKQQRQLGWRCIKQTGK